MKYSERKPHHEFQYCRKNDATISKLYRFIFRWKNRLKPAWIFLHTLLPEPIFLGMQSFTMLLMLRL